MPHLLIGCLLALVANSMALDIAGAVQAGVGGTRDTSRITLERPRPGPRHPITVDDILALREVQEARLSPEGQWVAFLLRQAFADCNCYRTALYLAPAGGGPPHKLLETAAITNLRWTPDGRALTYLSPRGGTRQVWHVAREGGPAEQLFRHELGRRFATLALPDTTQADVDHYEWSPDGTQIAFTTRPLPDSATIRRLTDDGVLYDDTRMWMLDILRHQWRRDPAELWLHDLRTHRDTRVWQAPQAGATSWSLGIVSMAWSPDSRKIAVSYASRTSVATGWVDYDVAIVRPAERAVSVLVATDSMSEHGAAWSPDGKRLAFLSEFNVPLNTTGSRSAIGIADLATGKTRYVARGKTGSSAERLWWVRRGAALAFESASAGGQHRDRGGVYVVELPGGAVRRLTPAEDHISSCGPVVNERIACVRQNPNLPPDPAVVDLATGQSQTIATANPQVADVIRGEVTELRWANKFGAETNGYLIRPFNYVPGHRYPLVLILYGFQGRFVAGAEWITNYPAQVLARDGFAVLLWNYPRWDDWPGNNFSRASVADGYGPLSSLESIVNILVIQGLADAHRVGIMGLSHGGYLTEFALTHSSQFRVASIANDGDFNPGIYWLVGTQAHRVLYEKFLGGPPHGATLANWLTYSPALNANRVSAPVLMETNAEETLFGLETFTALRHHHIPVELVVYPDDSHVLSQPRHRLASMQRNLDWFRFWLLGREDPDSAKQEQYERWRRMRADLPRLTQWSPAPLCATGAGTSSASPSRPSTRSNCDLAGARGARH